MIDYLRTVAGGDSGGGGGKGDPPGDPPPPSPEVPETPPAAEEPEELEAVLRNLEKQKNENIALRKRLGSVESELDKTKAAQMSEHDRLLNESYQKGVAETTALYATKLLHQSILTQATGKMADPTDAVKLLDLDGLDADDPDGIEEAIEELLTQKPHLAADQRGPSRIDQGPQGRAPKPETSADDWLRSVAGRR